MFTSTIPTPTTRTDTGTLPGGISYAKVGGGPRTLAVLPGFGDAMFSGTYPPLSSLTLAPYFSRYLDEYTVYVLSRPRGLATDYDAKDAVEPHARALESLSGSSSSIDVIGISMGGLIGQALARRKPELIDRLVLANSASRLADDAVPSVERLENFARDRDWFRIRSELARAMFADGRAVAYPPMIRTVGRLTLPRLAVASDTWRSLEFVLDFDASDELAEIDQPTLVFGGDRDPYFTEPVLQETAEALPSGELSLVSGAKHGAFHDRKHAFDRRARTFLER